MKLMRAAIVPLFLGTTIPAQTQQYDISTFAGGVRPAGNTRCWRQHSGRAALRGGVYGHAIFDLAALRILLAGAGQILDFRALAVDPLRHGVFHVHLVLGGTHAV